MTYNLEISGSLIQAYYICKRQLWLMSRKIRGDQDNDMIKIGRHIDTSSFKKNKKELKFKKNIIDIIKTSEKELTVVEVKKSSKNIESAKMQLLYYMYCMLNKNITVKGELRIPEEKKIIHVELNENNISELLFIIDKIKEILSSEKIIGFEKNRFCRQCSYSDFCRA